MQVSTAWYRAYFQWCTLQHMTVANMHDKQNIEWKCQWPTTKITSLCLFADNEEGTYKCFRQWAIWSNFMHGDSINVLFITMEMHGQLDIKKYEYFSSHMVVLGRWLRPNTKLLCTRVLANSFKNSSLNISGRQNARGGCGVYWPRPTGKQKNVN